MILRDKEGEIECRMFEPFLCKPGPDRPTARMEILFPPSRQDPAHVCCEVMAGYLVDLHGKKHGPGTRCNLPADRVAAAVRRYRARHGIEQPSATRPTARGTRGNELLGEPGVNLSLFQDM